MITLPLKSLYQTASDATKIPRLYLGSNRSFSFSADITTNLIMKGKKITKSDGKVYLEITDVIAKLMPGKMEMTLENLFNGDKQLGQYMIKCN